MVEIRKVLPGGDGREHVQISPTDIAQFIRLEQCQRYLRLQLFRRNGGSGFMRDYGVVPQSIPPLLTRSGAEFERRIEGAIAPRHNTLNFATAWGDRTHENEAVCGLARSLPPGGLLFLFQPRLSVPLGDWRLRGDIDILRLERDHEGALHILIADMKSSTSARVEHRLQVAFYHEMLAALFAAEGIDHQPIELGILYRGPADGADDAARHPLSEQERARRMEQEAAAERYFGSREGLLEIVADPAGYRGAVHELVTAPDSTAAGIAAADFDTLPFALGYKCDGCMYNEFCLRWSAQQDDLSLLPYLTSEDKSALQRHGIRSMRELAALKDFRQDGDGPAYRSDLVPAPGKAKLVRTLAATWPVGPRLDELVVRAKRYRLWKGDQIEFPAGTRGRIPSKGYGSLPYCDAGHNPNLVRVYLDAQHDYLHDRVYLLGALVVACEHGKEVRRRHIVHLAEGQPDSPEHEEEIFLRWTRETVQAVVELAAPDESGQPQAPIHLIFWDGFAQRVLLDGLARHFPRVLAATPLYDFVTQLAAFDSPIVSFLDREIRELKNYPMLCQSLQAVAEYRKFDWNRDVAYRQIFRTRMFDFRKTLEGANPQQSPWYVARARFNSQVPLEYAYAAWQELAAPSPGKRDEFAPYRGVTPALLAGFQVRRLEAMEHVAHDFRGNQQTEKRCFLLPDLAGFSEKAETLAQALQEFLTIERHAELADWKSAHLPPPERRALAGVTLLARYREEDQDTEVVQRNRENLACYTLAETYKAAAQAAQPDAKPQLSKEQKAETKWDQAGLRVRLHLECAGLDCDLEQLLGLSIFRPGERVVVSPRTTVDSRLPASQQVSFTPTPKQMLYAPRAELITLQIERDGAGRAAEGWIELEMTGARAGNLGGYVFGAIEKPFTPGELYTIDEDPNDWYGYFLSKVADGLVAGGASPLYNRLAGPTAAPLPWPEAAAAGQQRFLDGLDALREHGALHGFEPSKRDYFARHGDAPILLVQGPPGTGKSYATAFALFARLQGAMAAGRDFRVFVTCKTHAATDVLLGHIARVQALLAGYRDSRPALFARYFDARLLDVPLFRLDPREAPPPPVRALHKKDSLAPGEQKALDALRAQPWCVLATAPGGTYRQVKDSHKDLFGHQLGDCLVLDEASQMNLPEAVMAALLLKEDGQLIVVGDHRQMPPIVKHNWSGEPRRTFQEFRAYESLFAWLLALDPPTIKFAESFRLHADMAEFLRQEIYVHDGIPFHSRRHQQLPPLPLADPFLAAVLAPEHPLVVVVHDETESLTRNPFEQELLAPVLEVLAAPDRYALDPEHGLGVVVPHRAQRAALQEALPCLTILDPAGGAPLRSAVDTVERFQGDERDVIAVSATESDPQYLVLSGEFLLDPRRLTVALSRAKRKMVLVASRSVFQLFSADEETFAHAQLWKNLLRTTCTVKLWEGTRNGRQVMVWGNGHAQSDASAGYASSPTHYVTS